MMILVFSTRFSELAGVIVDGWGKDVCGRNVYHVKELGYAQLKDGLRTECHLWSENAGLLQAVNDQHLIMSNLNLPV